MPPRPLTRRAGAELGPLQRVAAAAATGVTSSLLSTPAELVIIQQQRTCRPLVETAAGLLRQHGAGVFARAGLPCALREAVYVAGYLGTAPLATSFLQQLPALEGRPDAALVLGGMASGAAAAVLTQPLDTVKTRMQANLVDAEGKYSSLRRGLATLWCVTGCAVDAPRVVLTASRSQGGGGGAKALGRAAAPRWQNNGGYSHPVPYKGESHAISDRERRRMSV